MRCPKFLFLVLAALLMGAANLPSPSDAAADETVQVVATVEPPAPAPAVAVVQAAADPLAALDVGQLAQLVQSPYGILLVAAGLVYLLFEIAKGLWLGLAAAPPARKRAIALLLGATVGGLLSLAGPVVWWIGLVAGALGAVVPVAGRALGQGLRTSGEPKVVIDTRMTHRHAGRIVHETDAATGLRRWVAYDGSAAPAMMPRGIGPTSEEGGTWIRGLFGNEVLLEHDDSAAKPTYNVLVPTKPKVTLRGGGTVAVLLVAGLLAAGGAGMYACSAAQVRDMRIAGTDALACLTQCGASEAVTTIKDWGDDGSVRLTWKDATKDMIDCATPCLWGLGIATFSTYALSAPYFGSAEDACIYDGTMTEIVVSPRKEK